MLPDGRFAMGVPSAQQQTYESFKHRWLRAFAEDHAGAVFTKVNGKRAIAGSVFPNCVAPSLSASLDSRIFSLIAQKSLAQLSHYRLLGKIKFRGPNQVNIANCVATTAFDVKFKCFPCYVAPKPSRLFDSSQKISP